MKRHKSLYPLSHDHHHGLVLAQLIKRGAPSYKNLPNTTEDKKNYTIKFYNEELTRHFHEEEEVLFPAIRNKTAQLEELCTELLLEHRRIYGIIQKLESGEDVEQNLNELGHLLTSHIRKEERILFPEAEEQLSDIELERLSEKLKREE